MNTKISKKIGRRGKIGLAVLIAVMFIGVASAGFLTHYNTITVNTNVKQAVLVDGFDVNDPIEQELDATGGEIHCFGHDIKNNAPIDATVSFSFFFDTAEPGLPPNQDGITVTYKDSVHLENKDSDWNIIDDDRHADIEFELVDEEFVYNLDVVGMEPETDYVFIYRADEEDRFTNWHGYGSIEIEAFTTDGDGNYSNSNSVELDTDLPRDTDWNNGPDADYTQAPDFYKHKTGAKLWVVTDAHWDNENEIMVGWDREAYLFDTELIRYFDNANHEITIPAGEFIDFEICYAFAIHIEPGSYTLITWIKPVV